MKKNINTADSIIRLILFVVLIMFVLNNYDDMLIRTTAAILAVYVLLTAVFQTCLLYKMLKIATRSPKIKRPFY